MPLSARAAQFADVVRSLLLSVRHAPDRALHDTRRRDIWAALVRAGRPRRVLFLCHGNVCRSPFAAALFARETARSGQATIETKSAGFVGPDRQSPENALVVAEQRYGLDMSAHRSVLVTAGDVAESDIVVVMSAAQARRVRRDFPGLSAIVVVLGDLDPDAIAKRTILDPWDGDRAKFEASYDRVERCVGELVRLTIGADVR